MTTDSLVEEDTSIVEIKHASITQETINFKSELDVLFDSIADSEIVDDENLQSIRASLQSYREEKYRNALCLLYPSIESIFNIFLSKEGKRPDEFDGLVKKVQWLEDNRRLCSGTTKIVCMLGLNKSRNLVVHGEFIPPEYLEPQCIMAYRFTNQILTEFKDGPFISD